MSLARYLSKLGALLSSDGKVQQAALAANVAGNGPAFFANMSGTQSASAGTYTKVAFNNKAYDTDSFFNSTASTVNGIPPYAFKPTTAGYYQINAGVYNQAANQTNLLRIYKAGTALVELARLYVGSAPTMSGASLVYLNGTTDYVEIYFYCSTTTTIGSNEGALCWVNGALVRAA